MKNSIVALVILFLAHSSCAQTTNSTLDLNLDFEKVEEGKPVGWNNIGTEGYEMTSDSEIKHSGNYSARIESTIDNPNFGGLAITLPNNYDGKKITLSGYIKTENVRDGFVGLWMRIDPGIAFNNMQEQGLKGTTDWTKYEITLDMNPEKTKRIIIGGLVAGEGTIWLDDFTLSIDGKDLKDLKPFQREVFPAELDKEFDEGSKIADLSLDENQVENLTTLGLVWGFLKYHHPNIAKGEYNWDYELFRVLPKVLATENSSDRDQVFVKWINDLGEFSNGKKAKIKASKVKTEPDLAWIESSNFSPELKDVLLKVKNAKRSGEHYYIGLQPGVGNPDFKNENSYASMKYPDAGYRLLALYRHWNIIQYYFPYKNLIEEDWKPVLKEFIPKFIDAKDETAYTLACLEIIARVNDTHANIWGGNEALNNYWGNNYAPLDVTFIENKAVVTEYYDEELGKESGLQIGDVITSINKKSVDQIVKERLIITPASSYPIKLRNIARNLLRTNESSFEIEFTRGGKAQKTTLKAYNPQDLDLFGKYDDADTCFKLINKDIAYFNNGSLQNKYLPEIWEEMKNTKGLIIDIRNYPTDFLVYELSNYLMPKSTPFVKFTTGNLKHPGFFTFTNFLKVGKKNKDYYKGKVVILTNETSQSSAEFHAMAYRVHPNATVIGSTTAGADGNISRFALPGGIATLITGIGVYYPDGTETQRVGIVPDIELRPTIQGIVDGRDELMERAVEVIEGED